jgi:zinc protease
MKRHVVRHARRGACLFFGIVVMVSCSVSPAFAEQPAKAAASVNVQPVPFEEQTLGNGLRVIYAPMTNAPVVHVRVLYHVGSKDEASDRNGFAHMFEHMMFRGSAHVPSEQHMKLIQGVGGVSNAFTSFDQTTYINTVPNTALEMALWLEADRMASFKVSDDVFKTERNVVKEEWRLRVANQPYGTMSQDLFAQAFKTHNYKWLPIGDMDHLAAAQTQELQDFHDRYYVPNNACLIVAGQFDVEQAKQWVEKYYGWIPKASDIQRVSKPEAPQTETRSKIVSRPNLPFARVSMAYKSPAYRSDDHLALELLSTILGSGRSSRLYQALVANDPIAAQVSMGNYQLEDPSVIFLGMGVLQGKDPAQAIDRARQVIAKVIAEGVTEEELAKAKTQTRVDLVQARTTAESIASVLGEEEVFGGDAGRVNTYFDRLEKLTIADLQAVAAKYLVDSGLTVVEYRPGDAGAATQPSVDLEQELKSAQKIEAATQPGAPVAGDEVAPARRSVEFPTDYPTTPPINEKALSASFAKGQAQSINGVQVFTLTDHRLPIVSMTLALRGGSHSVATEKEGVASLASSMLSRGAGGQTAVQIAEELESRGVSVGVSDDGDVTRVTASGMIDQIDFAIGKLKQIALSPDFPEDEFAKLKRQSLQGLMGALSDPGSVADRELDAAVYGEHPLGKNVTPESLSALTIDDVKAYYQQTFKPENAILIFAGAIDQSEAEKLAKTVLEGWPTGAPPTAQYDVPMPQTRTILLVDNPEGQQAVVRVGLKGYTLKDEDRFAGSVAGQVLSSGIDSRLNRVLRAEKGLTYGAYGYFRPSRNGGAFEFSVETKPESVEDAITSAFGVIDEMKAQNITDFELNEAKRRTAGLMVLETQTIQQQAGRRLDTILNDYPADYYDNYAKRIAEVTADEVRAVLNKYVVNDQANIIVVGPADKVKDQLAKFGEVGVVEMPLKAAAKTTTQPAK